MGLYERINTILLSKALSKKAFAHKLMDLCPKLKRTGDTPTLTTIYSYLNGNREIPVELISYISEVLDISEQELFEPYSRLNKKLIDFIFKNPSQEDFIQIEKHLKNTKYHAQDYEVETAKLLRYAPKAIVMKIQEKLEPYKQIHDALEKEL